MQLEGYIAGVAVALWFAHGWFLNTRLERVHEKLDRLMKAFDGLRDYLYEIDPQFDDERDASEAFERGDGMFAGMNEAELLSSKRAKGQRTLHTSFVE